MFLSLPTYRQKPTADPFSRAGPLTFTFTSLYSELATHAIPSPFCWDIFSLSLPHTPGPGVLLPNCPWGLRTSVEWDGSAPAGA